MSRSTSNRPGRSRWSSFAASASVVAQRTPNPSESAISSSRSFTSGSSVMARIDADTTATALPPAVGARPGLPWAFEAPSVAAATALYT